MKKASIAVASMSIFFVTSCGVASEEVDLARVCGGIFAIDATAEDRSAHPEGNIVEQNNKAVINSVVEDTGDADTSSLIASKRGESVSTCKLSGESFHADHAELSLTYAVASRDVLAKPKDRISTSGVVIRGMEESFYFRIVRDPVPRTDLVFRCDRKGGYWDVIEGKLTGDLLAMDKDLRRKVLYRSMKNEADNLRCINDIEKPDFENLPYGPRDDVG